MFSVRPIFTNSAKSIVNNLLAKNLLSHNALGSLKQRSVFSPIVREFHLSTIVCGPIKTKQAAAKRLLKTGGGNLKYGHAGKSHLNQGKSRKRIRNLNAKGILTGVWAKKMHKLLSS